MSPAPGGQPCGPPARAHWELGGSLQGGRCLHPRLPALRPRRSHGLDGRFQVVSRPVFLSRFLKPEVVLSAHRYLKRQIYGAPWCQEPSPDLCGHHLMPSRVGPVTTLAARRGDRGLRRRLPAPWPTRGRRLLSGGDPVLAWCRQHLGASVLCLWSRYRAVAMRLRFSLLVTRTVTQLQYTLSAGRNVRRACHAPRPAVTSVLGLQRAPQSAPWAVLSAQCATPPAERHDEKLRNSASDGYSVSRSFYVIPKPHQELSFEASPVRLPQLGPPQSAETTAPGTVDEPQRVSPSWAPARQFDQTVLCFVFCSICNERQDRI